VTRAPLPLRVAADLALVPATVAWAAACAYLLARDAWGAARELRMGGRA
jgi:hypothetical protein